VSLLASMAVKVPSRVLKALCILIIHGARLLSTLMMTLQPPSAKEGCSGVQHPHAGRQAIQITA